ncbi:MAG: tetratricopeptide repeat protein, partial [Gammaproteobacteria bacterium]|nr:tetratricopeptide repeat protein [Gammaproteobacteria bacterium]
MELTGTKGEKWLIERVPQGVHITIGPVEDLLEAGISDIFSTGLNYASVALSIKAIEDGAVYSVSNKSARVGSSDGQIYIELNLLHRPGTYYRNSLGLEESRNFLKHLKDMLLGNSALAEASRKVGRNEPCPCGSGRKYKRCCESKKSILLSDKLAFVRDIQDEHVSQFIMIAERDPGVFNDENFWEEFGGILGSAGAHTQAEEAFRNALELNPDNQIAILNLAVQLGILGDSSKALDLIDSLPDNTKRKAVIKANIMRELERYDEAICLYEKAIAEEPNFALPYVSILYCLRQTKNPLLEFWIERAIKSIPKDPSIVQEYARHLYMTGRLDQLAEADWIDNLEARVDIDFSIVGRGEEDPGLIACAQLWREIGYVSRDNDVQHLERALNLLEILGPGNLDLVCEHARIITVLASNLGQPEAVERSFKWMHEICRSSENGCETLEAYLGVANCEAGHYDDAIACFEIVLKTQPEDKIILWNYWWSLDEVGRIQDALQVAERLYNIDPTLQDLEYNLGSLCEQVGNHAAAMEYYDRQIQRIPEHWQSLENSSFLALLDNDIKSATNYFDQAMNNTKLSIESYSTSASEVDDWVHSKREKFTQLEGLARSNLKSKSYSKDIIRANNDSEPQIGNTKIHLSRHVFSIEDVIAAIENPQNPHAKEVLRQHKAVQRGDRSVVISFLEDNIPAWNWLPESSQNSLIESEMRFKDGQTLDYAPVVVGFAKAVEVTLKHKIFDVFKENYVEKT